MVELGWLSTFLNIECRRCSGLFFSFGFVEDGFSLFGVFVDFVLGF